MYTHILSHERSAGLLRVATDAGFALTQGRTAIQSAAGQDRVAGDATSAAHQVHITPLGDHAFTLQQTLRNTSDKPLAIQRITMLDGVVELQGRGWSIAHAEMARAERYFDNFTLLTSQLLTPALQTRGCYGMSEDQPFPGLVFTHPERGTVLIAALSQNHSKPVWDIQPGEGENQGKIQLAAREWFTGIDHLPLPAGQTLTSEKWLILSNPGGLEDTLDAYYDYLRKEWDFAGNDSPLRHAIVWGSWNYNYRERGHGDIDHDYIHANAKAFAKLAPNHDRFVMIDDGYQQHKSNERTGWFASFLQTVYDDGLLPHDPKLFPRGMRAMADDIRATGARPALWVTPRLHQNSALAREHPEWLVQLDDNRSYGKLTAFLDYSIPEAREFTRHAWKTVFDEWGFDAVKVDFWTMAFEVPCIRFRNPDRTAVELRNLFLQDLRELLPKDGYLIMCCAVSNGNPFIGRYADATRNAMDVGDGDWQHIRDSAAALTAATPFFRHDCLLADTDSFGWCPRISPGENRAWTTLCLMTEGMCEIAGDLTQLPEPGVDLLHKAMGFFAGSKARRTITHIDQPGLSRSPAPHLVQHREDGVYEAYINWGSYLMEVHLPGTVRDLWTGKELTDRHHLPARDAILFKRDERI